jgi:hypothetical protein
MNDRIYKLVEREESDLEEQYNCGEIGLEEYERLLHQIYRDAREEMRECENDRRGDY